VRRVHKRQHGAAAGRYRTFKAIIVPTNGRFCRTKRSPVPIFGKGLLIKVEMQGPAPARITRS